VRLAVIRLGLNAYGMMVRREIHSATARDISIGALYATLGRLESKGLIKAPTEEPTAERGGQAKRHFRMTPEGERALGNTHKVIQKMSAGPKGLQIT